MSPLTSEKYNVAWFKLAEFVKRGEKERALGMYRLLSYSLTDAALSSQLEGDLLLSFRDEKALESYVRAALLYEQQDKLNHTIAIYEHLITLIPENNSFACKLITLYEHADREKVLKIVMRFVDLRLAESIEALDQFLSELQVSTEYIFIIHEYIVLKLLDKAMPFEVVKKYINKAMQAAYSETHVINFIAQISELSSEARVYASQFKEAKK